MYVTQLSNARSAVSTAQANLDTMGRQNVQRMAINSAVEDATAKVRAVNNDSTDDVVAAADTAVAALETAIGDAADLSGDSALAIAEGRLADLKNDLMHAKTTRLAALEAAEKEKQDQMAKEEAARVAEMIATALKLHTGISAPGGTGDDTRTGAYGTGDNADDIAETIGTAAAVNLSEDKDAVVAVLKGWEGDKYTYAVPAFQADGTTPNENAGDTYEAVVCSHVGEPTEGAKFNVQYTDLDATTGERPIDTSTEAVQALVASSSFDQSAGAKEFELGTNLQRVIIAGSFHGVSGTYYCTPAADSTCAARKAAEGFELGSTADAGNAFTAGGWTFKPTNPEARLMETPDNAYASYGWWLHKSANDEVYNASAFHDYKGEDTPTVNIDTLRGTATYTGGAAGKYALSSSTGGANDAGHFAATATLKATIAADHTISGTIDGFMGADGMSRDWSVELKEASVADAGGITGPATEGTVWTRGETAADASGTWSGNLREQGDDGVPGIATGVFYTEYGRDGKMVGAFGASE